MVSNKNEKHHASITIGNFNSTTNLTPNESINEKRYNPFEHRILEHPNTFWGALMHVLKSSLGTGILAVPMAFMYSGLLVGVIGTALIGLLITHTVHILVTISHRMCVANKVPYLGFSDTAEAVFKNGPKQFRPWAEFARLFVDIGLCLCYFFNNGVYTVFIADSLEQIMSYYFPHDEVPRIWLVLIVTLLLILFCQVRPLKFLVPFSVIANVTMITAFGITFYYMSKSIPNVSLEDRSLAKGISGIPRFMVTVVFGLEGIGTIMPVENSMQKPQFIGCPGVLNIGFSILVLIFATMGFFGYYAFGEDTKASITYSLTKTEDLAMIARGCIATAIFFTYMLQFYVPMEITWRNVNHRVPAKYHNIFQISYRAAAVIFITIIAIVVPDLSAIIDIVGSVFYSTLGIFTPCFLEILINWEIGYGKCNWKLYKNVFIMVLAIFVLCSGVYYATLAIINPESNE